MENIEYLNISITLDQKEIILQALRTYYSFLQNAVGNTFGNEEKSIFEQNIKEVSELILKLL